jgi:hypothetical protein
MEILTRIVGGELFASLALVVVPWGVAKLFGWWKAECRRKGDADYTRSVEALEVGVDEAWERFGREWKHARVSAAGEESSGSNGEPTGKLTDEEREHLRTVARDVAVEVGRGKGLDVLKVLGVRAIGTLIRRIVERRKRGE